MRRVTMLFAAATLILATGCKKNETSPAERRQAAESSIGVRASIAAGLHVEAERACEIIGVPKIEKCAKSFGNLLAEREAQLGASMSVDRTRSYFDVCVVEFGVGYCNSLLERAIQIERRKPPSTGEVQLPERE